MVAPPNKLGAEVEGVPKAVVVPPKRLLAGVWPKVLVAAGWPKVVVGAGVPKREGAVVLPKPPEAPKGEVPNAEGVGLAEGCFRLA